jgi:hypothetical protein
VEVFRYTKVGLVLSGCVDNEWFTKEAKWIKYCLYFSPINPRSVVGKPESKGVTWTDVGAW